MAKFSKFIVFTVLAIAMLPHANILALDTEVMEELQKKVNAASDRITSSDQEIIDNFIAEGLQEILSAQDAPQIAEIRSQLARFAGPAQPSEYSLAYIKAIKSKIPETLTKVASLEKSARKTSLELNLMALLARLESSDLAPYALPFISHKNAAINYWAVKSIANASVANQLNSDITGDEELKEKINSALIPIITENTPAVTLRTIVDFAANLKGEKAKDMLEKIAALRINNYADWTVKYELMDAALLNAIAEQIPAIDENEEKNRLSRMFAQLYSYVIQKLILSAENIDDITKQSLIAVIIDVEEKGLSKLMNARQIEMKYIVSKNLKQESLENLRQRHDTIFGREGKPGALANDLNFNYGSSPQGTLLTYPKKLKPRIIPEETTETE